MLYFTRTCLIGWFPHPLLLVARVFRLLTSHCSYLLGLSVILIASGSEVHVAQMNVFLSALFYRIDVQSDRWNGMQTKTISNAKTVIDG